MSDGRILRPGHGELGAYVSTPRAVASIRLLGAGAGQGGIVLTRDEFREVQRVYGFKPEDPPDPLLQAGHDRNALRTASADGLRAIAFLAKFCEAREDPVKVIVRMAAGLGYDVSGDDVEWAEAESGEMDMDPEGRVDHYGSLE